MYLAFLCLLSMFASVSIASPASALKYAWDPPRNAAEMLARDAHLQELGLESGLSKRTQFPDYPPSCKLCEKDYPNIQSCANASVVFSQPSVVRSVLYFLLVLFVLPRWGAINRIKRILKAEAMCRLSTTPQNLSTSSSARAPIRSSPPTHNVSTALLKPTRRDFWFHRMVSPCIFMYRVEGHAASATLILIERIDNRLRL